MSDVLRACIKYNIIIVRAVNSTCIKCMIIYTPRSTLADIPFAERIHSFPNHKSPRCNRFNLIASCVDYEKCVLNDKIHVIRSRALCATGSYYCQW